MIPCGCTKENSSGRDINVTLTNACTGENASGDSAYDFCSAKYVGFKTDAGDRGAAKATVPETGMMNITANVSTEATKIWCYSGGAIGTIQTFTVPASISKDGSSTEDDLNAMVYCSKEASISGDAASLEIYPVTSGMLLNILDSKGQYSGYEISSITIEAADGTEIAGDISLNFEKAGISAISESSSTISITCTEMTVGTDAEPASVGAVLIPCSFTGTITVTGPQFTSVTTISTPLNFQAGYIKTVPVDLATASVSTPLRIGVIGDSISSFEGMIPDGYRYYYPKSDCDVDTWEKTYWGLLINNWWKGVLDVNCSYSGGCVAPCSTKTPGSDFISRARDFIDPDIVLIHGGTNDAITSNGISQGDYDYDSPFGAMNTWCRFRDSYISVIKYIQANHPDARIVIIIGDHVTGEFGDSVAEIAKHYGLPVVDFRGDTNVTKYSGSHPDAAGMAYMATKIYQETADELFN